MTTVGIVHVLRTPAGEHGSALYATHPADLVANGFLENVGRPQRGVNRWSLDVSPRSVDLKTGGR